MNDPLDPAGPPVAPAVEAVLRAARALATSRGHAWIGRAHLVVALSDRLFAAGGGLSTDLIASRERALDLLESGVVASGTTPTFSPRVLLYLQPIGNDGPISFEQFAARVAEDFAVTAGDYLSLSDMSPEAELELLRADLRVAGLGRSKAPTAIRSLAERAKEGDDEALDGLIEAFAADVVRLAEAAAGVAADAERVMAYIERANHVFVVSIHGWRPYGDVTFEHYALGCVRDAMQRFRC